MRLQAPIALLIVACSCFALASSRSQRARGAAVFEVSGCQHCHSIHNVGGHKGPDLSGVGRLRSKSDLRQQIVHGGKIMPAFGEVLEPDEINDLIAYLHSCRQKPAIVVPALGSN
ncbi:MAG: cytochrome c [Terracidiphilus sp.]|jgi:mono/diheme cytochrome c family protein